MATRVGFQIFERCNWIAPEILEQLKNTPFLLDVRAKIGPFLDKHEHLWDTSDYALKRTHVVPLSAIVQTVQWLLFYS